MKRFVSETELSGWDVHLTVNVCIREEPHLRSPLYPFFTSSNDFAFFTTEHFNYANLYCAVYHNMCYSYSQTLAKLSTLFAPSTQRKISILYSKVIIQSVCSVIFTYC